MKTINLLFTFLIVSFLLVSAAPKLRAEDEMTLDFFYDHLADDGVWQDVGDYGYCWQPREVDADWRPYSEGRWVYTEAGWTWDSDESFGWAVYHYGRWSNVRHLGWIWIPGTEWGPGWVAWRNSNEYVGWAPLPPEAHFRHDTGFRAWVDDYYDIGPSNYCFVASRDFGSRRLRSVFLDRNRNISLVMQTSNVTNITYDNRAIHNGGPSFDQLSQRSQHAIGRYKLERRQHFEGDQDHNLPEHFKSRIDDERLSMFAMPFAEHYKSQPKKMAKRLETVEVEHGWRNAGTEQEIKEARSAIKHKGDHERPDDLPRQPKFQKALPAPSENEKPHKPSESKPPKARPNQDEKPPTTEEKKIPRNERPPGSEDSHKPSKDKRPEEPKHPSKAERKDPKSEPREPKQEAKKEPKQEARKEPKQEPKRAESKTQPDPKPRPKGDDPKPDKDKKTDKGKDNDNGKEKGKKGKKDNVASNGAGSTRPVADEVT